MKPAMKPSLKCTKKTVSHKVPSEDAEKMRKKYLNFFAACATAVCMLNACSHKTEKPVESVVVKVQNPSPEAEHAAIENGAEYVKEITFTKGSAELTAPAKEQLNGILINAYKLGKIDDIKVISWADKEYPSAQKKKLAKADQNLADKRNEAIETFIESYTKEHAEKKLSVEKYNMAKRPNSLQKLFGTSNARMKKSLEEAGISTATKTSQRLASKSSKSIVMVAFDEAAK